jgi:hypothetical protein
MAALSTPEETTEPLLARGSQSEQRKGDWDIDPDQTRCDCVDLCDAGASLCDAGSSRPIDTIVAARGLRQAIDRPLLSAALC